MLNLCGIFLGQSKPKLQLEHEFHELARNDLKFSSIFVITNSNFMYLKKKMTAPSMQRSVQK